MPVRQTKMFRATSKLAEYRATQGMSQMTLSLLTGIGQAAISRIERGRTPLMPATAKRLTEGLGTTIEQALQNGLLELAG